MNNDLQNTRKKKILIVDDSEMNRSILADMLDGEYDILEAGDGVEAIAILKKQVDISLVLLDIVMPEMDGFAVLNVMNQKRWIETIPVIMISAESDASNVKKAYELGVTDFISRPFDMLIVRRRVDNTILLYSKQKKLIGMLADQIYEKERNNSMMVDILSHIVEFRNGESGLHILHVRTLTEVLLKQLQRKTDKYKFSSTDIAMISLASALHDIGKIAVNEEILNKPGRLTPEEFEVIKTHAVVGAQMLSNLPAYENEPLLKTAQNICRWHHERYDGRGYPDGLKGDEIPIAAQIVALADTYDALTSNRCYKKSYPHETAVEMILDGQCGTFNPLLMECLKDIAPTLEEELSVTSLRKAQPDLLHLSQDIMYRSDTNPSQRSLRLLDYERMKFNFFAEMTEEIQFEYTPNPPMLALSGMGAKKLGLSEIIMEPQKDEKLRHMLGADTWDYLSTLLRATTPDKPVIKYDCQLLCGEQLRWNRMILRSMWSTDNPPSYIGAIGKLVDIHDSRMMIEKLEQRASHDALTELLNRASAEEQIKQRLESDPDGKYMLAILDLDRLKNANDCYGHMFGDKILRCLADRIRKNTSDKDVVARVGGDEFLLFMEYKTDVEQVIHHLFDAITRPCDGFMFTVSVGIVKTGQVENKYEKLFHAADQALYYAKRSGRQQYRFYDDSMRETLSTISPIDTIIKGDQIK